MGILKKEFWVWDESFNNTGYKLGQSISELINNGKISATETVDEYKIRDNDDLLFLKARNDEIAAIFISKTARSFIKEGLLETPYDTFKEEMNKILTPTDQKYKGDLIFVQFRDFFVSNISIIRKDGIVSQTQE